MRPWTLLVALAGTISAAALNTRASNSLQVDSSLPAVGFDYTVSTIDSTNWIAIYKTGNSPSVNKYSYSAWSSAPKASGNSVVDTSSLAPGDYNAYLLAKNGYDILAGPTPVTLSSSNLSVDSDGPPLTFNYDTKFPDSTNWIVIYKDGNSPTSNKYGYAAWGKAPSASGSSFVDVTGVAEGTYQAYLLAKNGYDVLAGPVAVPVAKARYVSSISESDKSKPFTVSYQTNVPDSTNWIAVYPPNTTEPDNVSYLSWATAGSSSGTVHLATDSLYPGQYDVFFLGKNRYTPIADKITLTYEGNTGPISFTVKTFTSASGRVGDAYKANIAGLVDFRKDTPTFAITGETNGKWARIDTGGNIIGTPTTSGATNLTIQATAANGSKTNLSVNIPVVAAGQRLISQLRFMTMNLWVGGTQVSDYHRKQMSFFVDQNVDVIALTETAEVAGQRLAKALGWYGHHTSDTSVISRYPVTAMNGTGYSTEALVSLDGDKSTISVWSAHLGYTPYGPYDFCQSHMTTAQVMQREADSGRTPQITDIVNAMKPRIANSKAVPVFLAGDFNAPSHLDWTYAARDQHCGYYNVPWPTSKMPVDAGLVDSFRELFPDSSKNPEFTWSPVHPAPEEPQDRLDFIYYAGAAKPVDSKALIVGTPSPAPNTRNNEWPSDHKAFLTVFNLL